MGRPRWRRRDLPFRGRINSKLVYWSQAGCGVESMKARFAVSLLCRCVAGAGSLLVSAYGAYAYAGADFQRDTLEMVLFCVLPALSFPVFLISLKSLRWSVTVHWILAAGYLAI